jgi:hypothetical protein
VAPPTPAALTFAARAAVQQIERGMPVVAVLPQGGLLGRQIAPLRRLAGVRLEVRAAAIQACIAASVVFTVNDEAAATALLSDTPVVHFGRALYGIPGVATRANLDTLSAKVREALTEDQPELRRRVLGWTLAHGHVWCSVDHPDHNGLSGLILQIERRVSRRSLIGGRLRYRAGPAWPLTAEGH